MRYGLLTANLALLVTAAGFISGAMGSSSDATSKAVNSVVSANGAIGPLDQLSSTDVAVNIARTTYLEEAVAVTNQADSAKVAISIIPADSSVAVKPQIIATDVKSIRDIQTYITQEGDTIASIAEKFNVTSESIRWSNNLTSGVLRAGTELTIPPVTGIVYTVQAGDTPEALAQKYRAEAAQIIAFNDAELHGLQPGQKIIIPNGTQPVQSRGSNAAVAAYDFYGGYNGYDRGWCTWYAANRVSIPNNWGNANTWASRARAAGWTVSSAPVPGAIAQTSAGRWGHVGIVEAVSPDGTMIKYSDMNGLAGFNRVGHSDWVPVNAKYQSYIYR